MILIRLICYIIIFGSMVLEAGLFSSKTNKGPESNKSNTSPKQVITLQVEVNDEMLKQINKVKDISKEKAKIIKDKNFDSVMDKQDRILSILSSYESDDSVFQRSLINIKLLSAKIDLYTDIFSDNKDLNRILLNIKETLDKEYQSSFDDLFSNFMDSMDIIVLAKLLLRKQDGLIEKVMSLLHTKYLNENEVQKILYDYLNQIKNIISQKTSKFYDSFQSEFNVEVRKQTKILPSQMLFIVFNCLKKFNDKKIKNLNKSYLTFKGKIGVIQQKITELQVYKTDDANKEVKKIISVVNTSMNTQEKYNNDIISEIDKLLSIDKSLNEDLQKFCSYTPDEKILEEIEKLKELTKN